MPSSAINYSSLREVSVLLLSPDIDRMLDYGKLGNTVNCVPSDLSTHEVRHVQQQSIIK